VVPGIDAAAVPIVKHADPGAKAGHCEGGDGGRERGGRRTAGRVGAEIVRRNGWPQAAASSNEMRQQIPGRISDAAMQCGVLDASGESALAARFREIMGGTDGDPWCGGVSSGCSRGGR
jgi:hypothetical protein